MNEFLRELIVLWPIMNGVSNFLMPVWDTAQMLTLTIVQYELILMGSR